MGYTRSTTSQRAIAKNRILPEHEIDEEKESSFSSSSAERQSSNGSDKINRSKKKPLRDVMGSQINIQTGPLVEQQQAKQPFNDNSRDEIQALNYVAQNQAKKMMIRDDYSERFSTFSLIFDRVDPLNKTQQALSEGALSVQNPVTEQAEALLEDIERNERHERLYGALNDTIVSLSTIREFDAKKDWLSKQVAPSSSSSEVADDEAVT